MENKTNFCPIRTKEIKVEIYDKGIFKYSCFLDIDFNDNNRMGFFKFVEKLKTEKNINQKFRIYSGKMCIILEIINGKFGITTLDCVSKRGNYSPYLEINDEIIDLFNDIKNFINQVNL